MLRLVPRLARLAVAAAFAAWAFASASPSAPAPGWRGALPAAPLVAAAYAASADPSAADDPSPAAPAPQAANAAAAVPAPQAAGEFDPCNVEGVERVVAVGDVHGAYDSFVSILKAAGIIDKGGRWAGATTHLVQTGDVVDRGPHPRKALDLLMRLEKEAAKAGGRVHALLGNHEVAVMLGDWRSTSPEEYDEFRTVESEEIRERYFQMALTEAREGAARIGVKFDQGKFRDEFMAKVPLGYVERKVAFGPTGTYGRWLREHNTVVRINRVLFLHAAISARVAQIGCAGINETVRAELTKDFNRTLASPLTTLVASVDGPLWYRGPAVPGDDGSEAELEKVLALLDARSSVGGHSVVGSGRIESKFGGRLFLIDTGMLASVYRGGLPSALELRGDSAVAIYLDGRRPLPFAVAPRSAMPVAAGAM